MEQLASFASLLLLLTGVRSYPDGASPDSCGHLTPGHGSKQTSTPPYSIDVPTNTYTAGAIIPVVISGAPYAGFILQAQIVGTRTVVGTFADPPLHSKVMSCTRSMDTMCHSSSMAKQNARYTWIAPNYDVHLVEFIATVAAAKDIWWSDIKSITMTFDPRPVTPPLPSFPPSVIPTGQTYTEPNKGTSAQNADGALNAVTPDVKPTLPNSVDPQESIEIILSTDSQEVLIKPDGANSEADNEVSDEVTRDEAAKLPSNLNSNEALDEGPHYGPRPPPEPWLGPGPDGHMFFHPWQRFSGWHGPRRYWKMHGYQSWRFTPIGRTAIDMPGVYEYRYYYRR